MVSSTLFEGSCQQFSDTGLRQGQFIYISSLCLLFLLFLLNAQWDIPEWNSQTLRCSHLANQILPPIIFEVDYGEDKKYAKLMIDLSETMGKEYCGGGEAGICWNEETTSLSRDC